MTATIPALKPQVPIRRHTSPLGRPVTYRAVCKVPGCGWTSKQSGLRAEISYLVDVHKSQHRQLAQNAPTG